MSTDREAEKAAKLIANGSIQITTTNGIVYQQALTQYVFAPPLLPVLAGDTWFLAGGGTL